MKGGKDVRRGNQFGWSKDGCLMPRRPGDTPTSPGLGSPSEGMASAWPQEGFDSSETRDRSSGLLKPCTHPVFR